MKQKMMERLHSKLKEIHTEYEAHATLYYDRLFTSKGRLYTLFQRASFTRLMLWNIVFSVLFTWIVFESRLQETFIGILCMGIGVISIFCHLILYSYQIPWLLIQKKSEWKKRPSKFKEPIFKMRFSNKKSTHTPTKMQTLFSNPKNIRKMVFSELLLASFFVYGGVILLWMPSLWSPLFDVPTFFGIVLSMLFWFGIGIGVSVLSIAKWVRQTTEEVHTGIRFFGVRRKRKGRRIWLGILFVIASVSEGVSTNPVFDIYQGIGIGIGACLMVASVEVYLSLRYLETRGKADIFGREARAEDEEQREKQYDRPKKDKEKKKEIRTGLILVLIGSLPLSIAFLNFLRLAIAFALIGGVGFGPQPISMPMTPLREYIEVIEFRRGFEKYYKEEYGFDIDMSAYDIKFTEPTRYGFLHEGAGTYVHVTIQKKGSKYAPFGIEGTAYNITHSNGNKKFYESFDPITFMTDDYASFIKTYLNDSTYGNDYDGFYKELNRKGYTIEENDILTDPFVHADYSKKYVKAHPKYADNITSIMNSPVKVNTQYILKKSKKGDYALHKGRSPFYRYQKDKMSDVEYKRCYKGKKAERFDFHEYMECANYVYGFELYIDASKVQPTTNIDLEHYFKETEHVRTRFRGGEST